MPSTERELMNESHINNLNEKTEQIAKKLKANEPLNESDFKLLFLTSIIKEEENENK